MKILVCIKQVADIESRYALSEDGKRMIFDAKTVFAMNRFDEFAVEEALLIMESLPGTVIDAVSAGPERVTSTIRRSMEMGVHNGTRIDLGDSYHSPMEVASLISSFTAGKNYDLILAGAMAEDTMEGITGQIIAEMLGYSSASSVIRQTIDIDSNTITVEREIDSSKRESVTMSLPAVLTIQSGINRPRYPSLSNVLRAKTQKIYEIFPSSQDMTRSNEKLIQISPPDASIKGIFLDGNTVEKATMLWEILHERSII
jgi:electron transfer flavoprotein beta subunit